MSFKDLMSYAKQHANVLVLAFVALCILFWGASRIADYRDRQAAKQYEAIRDWKVDLRPYLGMQLFAKTKVVEGRMLTSMTIHGYPTLLSDSKVKPKGQDVSFSLNFQDGDGFNVFEKLIRFDEMGSAIDSGANQAVLKYQFEDFLSIESYKRISQLNVEWTTASELAKSGDAGDAGDAQSLDQCASGLSKAERLKRLARHGKVRQSGSGEYAAGNKSLSFMEDGAVFNCR